MIVFLLGFMGCGKSTLGKKLAQSLNSVFIDLDDYVESQAGQSINELFAEKGELYFRNLESECLHTICAENTSAVVSLGGGTPCFANNMRWVTRFGTSVYLSASPQELFNRLKGGREHRPLLANKTDEELLAFIVQKLSERNPFYQQAQLIFNTEKGGPEELYKLLMQH